MERRGAVSTRRYGVYGEGVEAGLGIDPRGPELYTSGWGGYPADRRKLYRWLREQEIVDNIVLSGDSHGWFGSDLTEDPQLPNYVPLTGLSLLQPVGVEMVGTSMGRPGLQDVVADELYWQANGGRDAAPFDDAETYDTNYRPAGLAAAIALETAAKAANINLIYFNWRAEYGHTMIHLRESEAILENWASPQRAMSDTAELLAQHSTPVGNPHLRPVLAPVAVVGARNDVAAPPPETLPPEIVTPDGPASDPVQGAGGSFTLGTAVLLGAAELLRRRMRATQDEDA